MITRGKRCVDVVLIVLMLIIIGLLSSVLTRRPSADSVIVNPSVHAVLSTWQTALGRRATTPATWVALGESVTEGQGASRRSNRWLDLTTTRLRTTYPTAGIKNGQMYTPAVYRVEPPASPWTEPWIKQQGTIKPAYNVADLGYRVLNISKNASVTYALTGDSTDIWYATGLGSGKLQYQVDGRKVVSIDTASGIFQSVLRYQHISLGADGRHMITISADQAPVTLAGFTTYSDDRSAGIHVYDSAHSGATVATFLQDIDNFKQTLATVNPQLITVELGINDYEQQTPPAQFRSQMQELIKVVASLPNQPSVEIIIPYQIHDITNASYKYRLYAQQLRSIAKSDPNHLALVDLDNIMPPADMSGKGMYTIDGIHPNNSGQRTIANLVYNSIR